eukprot:tig00000378_g24502.t1
MRTRGQLQSSAAELGATSASSDEPAASTSRRKRASSAASPSVGAAAAGTPGKRGKTDTTAPATPTAGVRSFSLTPKKSPPKKELAAKIKLTPALKEKAQLVMQKLDELYPAPPIPLEHRDGFQLLCAVVLSAQTTDKKVNEVTPTLFAEAPTPEAMAGLPVERIAEIIRQIGLAPQKSKALKGLSMMLVDEFGGQVPKTYEELERLPGVGHKTASVVMAQVHGEPALPVDTHIHRLAARWGLSDGSKVEQTEADLKLAFPREAWNRLHLQIIYFGREHCPAQRHEPSACPICSWAAPSGSRSGAKGKAKAKAGRTKDASESDGDAG